MTKSDTIRHHAANGMTAAQIAVVVGVSAGAVRSVLSRDNRNSATAPATRATTATTATTPKREAATVKYSFTVAETAKQNLKRVGEIPAAKVLPGVSKKTALPLWLCLALSAGCSVQNMLWVAHQLKGDITQAWAVTAAFTVAPFLLLYYGVGKWWRWVPYVPIVAEVLCNAASFYGGMTGLGHGHIVRPTKFLHMFTTMTNSGNEGTALLLSAFFAVCIALLAIVPVVELEKRGK